jgi:hypothetical protein
MKRIRKIGTGAAVTWILLAALTACAAAQDQGQRPFTKPFHSIIPAENRSDSISPDSVSPKLKSEGTALAYSLVATLAPAATIYFAIPGLIIGPSAGYFYAGLSNRAWQGISFRLVGVGGMFVAYGMCGWNCGPGDSEYGMSQIIFYSSAGVILVSAVYDIAAVSTVVHKHNAALMKLGNTIAPIYFADSGAFGLKVNFRF